MRQFLIWPEGQNCLWSLKVRTIGSHILHIRFIEPTYGWLTFSQKFSNIVPIILIHLRVWKFNICWLKHVLKNYGHMPPLNVVTWLQASPRLFRNHGLLALPIMVGNSRTMTLPPPHTHIVDCILDKRIQLFLLLVFEVLIKDKTLILPCKINVLNIHQSYYIGFPHIRIRVFLIVFISSQWYIVKTIDCKIVAHM